LYISNELEDDDSIYNSSQELVKNNIIKQDHNKKIRIVKKDDNYRMKVSKKIVKEIKPPKPKPKVIVVVEEKEKEKYIERITFKDLEIEKKNDGIKSIFIQSKKDKELKLPKEVYVTLNYK